MEIKLCRAAGATKTQIHSKVNIQCIIVMCLVVCVYGKGEFACNIRCLMNKMTRKVIMQFNNSTSHSPPTSFSSVLINDSIIHIFLPSIFLPTGYKVFSRPRG